jgi:DNA-directed RNA polymerase beta subunit
MQETNKLRNFFDPPELNRLIQSHALEGYKKKIEEIETPDFKLQLKDLAFDQKKFSIHDQKKAVLEKKDLTVPLKGTIELFDKRSGKVTETKNTTIAHVPFVTERNTVIYNGSEYEPIHQQRLLPGIYARIKQTGEAEAHINPEPRTGVSSRVIFIPETQLFVMMIQNTQIKLYGILKALGMTDPDMQKYWGKEILDANRAAYTGDEIDKLYSKLYF